MRYVWRVCPDCGLRSCKPFFLQLLSRQPRVARQRVPAHQSKSEAATRRLWKMVFLM